MLYRGGCHCGANKHAIEHRFCPSCGIHPYEEGVDPQGRAKAMVDLRCVDGLDLDSIPVQHVDGASR